MYFFWCKKKGKESAVEIPMGAQSVPKSSTQATKSSDVVSHSKEQQDTPLWKPYVTKNRTLGLRPCNNR